jgi:D-glycero-D-manno-heptose 1,7-bisphosphate phosphatase
MKKAVFLDRDGVINKATILDGIPKPPKYVEEVMILSGVKKAIKMLNEHNFEIVVITNQPDVARGSTSKKSVEEINSYLSNRLGINHIFTCYHDDIDGCDCRKPKPGLLLNAARNLDLDLQKSFLIGDRWRDITAGQAAGCTCFFIDYEYKEKSPVSPFKRVSSLLEATHLILENHNVLFS